MILKTIEQALSDRALVSVASTASVEAACKLLDQHNIGALAVQDNGRLVGILSERDVISKCCAHGKVLAEIAVSTVMTSDPVTVRRTASLAQAMGTMLDGGFRHVPVVDGVGEAVGMLSIRDIPTEYRLMVERAQSGPTLAAK